MLGRRAARAGLEQPAAVHQRHDREHLRARAELEDREQVGEVVAQHVAGDRDRVLAAAAPLEREARRLGDRQDLDLEPVGVVLGEVALDLREHLGVVRARLVEPEHRRRAGRPRALDRELHPVGAPGASLVWHARQMSPASTSCSSSVAPARSTTRTVPGGRDLERLVVAAVLLGLLRHQADVRRRAHRRRVERAVLAAEVDRLGVERRVARVRDHRLGVLLLAGRVPHLARRADHRRHRRVDDHVARHVQVGDPAVGVDHREVGPGLVGRARSPPRSPRARPASRSIASGRSPARCSG